MVNLNSSSKRALLPLLNLQREVAGKLHGNKLLVINKNITYGPEIYGERGSVIIPEHSKRYHTHPRITFPVPSAENIMSAFDRKSRKYSVIVTAWGIFIVENKNYRKNTNLSLRLYNSRGMMYHEHITKLFPMIQDIIDYLVYNIIQALPPKAKNKTAPLKGKLKQVFDEFLVGVNIQFHLYFQLTFVPW